MAAAGRVAFTNDRVLVTKRHYKAKLILFRIRLESSFQMGQFDSKREESSQKRPNSADKVRALILSTYNFCTEVANKGFCNCLWS